MRPKTKQPTAEELLATINRPLPHSKESERGLISALIQGPQRIRSVRSRVSPEAFYHLDTRTMYAEILAMDEQAVPFDLVMLTNRLRDQSKLDDAGGIENVTAVFTYAPSPALCKLYADDVETRWRQRRAIHGHAAAVAALFDHAPDDEIASTINTATQIAQAYADASTAAVHTTATLTQCLHEHLDHMTALNDKLARGEEPLIPTGIASLDAGCGGIGEDEYWLVTGPTKSGKSVFTGCIAKNAALRGVPAKVYSNEVGRRTYAGRLLASAAEKLDGRIERRGIRTHEDQEQYLKAMKSLQGSIGKLLKIDNAAGKYVEDIVADMRSEAESGTKLFIVDLIGKVRTRQRFETRERELAHISLSLYEATKRYCVACVVVAQENEEGRVRESKALEMDCEAWIKVCHVQQDQEQGRRRFGQAEKKPEIVRDRRDLVVELARGFAAGDRIRCLFDGARFLIRELDQSGDWIDSL